VHLWSESVLIPLVGDAYKEKIDDDTFCVVFKETTDALPVLHVLLAKEGSPAGVRWNPATYKFLLNLLKHHFHKKDKFIHLLKSTLYNNLKLFTKDVQSVEVTWLGTLQISPMKLSRKSRTRKTRKNMKHLS